MTKKRFVAAAALCVALVGTWATVTVIAQATSESSGLHVRGGGTSIISEGTGAPNFTPVTTKIALRWRNGEGHFECLALAPSNPAGSPGSGKFDTNVMYVTGDIDSARLAGRTAVLGGTATVTGLGAGSNRRFTVTVTRGGPGARVVLEVSGLTFDETLLEGEIRF